MSYFIELTAKEERYFEKELHRTINNVPYAWGAGEWVMHISTDSAGNYPVMTITPQVEGHVIKIEILASQNKLQGGRRYFFNIVATYEPDKPITEIEGTISVTSSIS